MSDNYYFCNKNEKHRIIINRGAIGMDELSKRKFIEAGEKTRFSSTRQPRNSGRKPKLYTIAHNAYSVSREEWDKVKIYLLQCTREELETIIDNKDTPVWVVVLARGLKRNATFGKTDVLSDMEDRLFGKAQNTIDVTTNGNAIGVMEGKYGDMPKDLLGRIADMIQDEQTKMGDSDL